MAFLDSKTQKLLLQNKLFQGLQSRELQSLSPIFTFSQYPNGEQLIKDGDVAFAIYIILEGEVEISKQREERSFVLSKLGPGELFGELALFDQQIRSANVRCATACHCILMDIKEFRALARVPQTQGVFIKMIFNLLEILGERLRFTNERTLDALLGEFRKAQELEELQGQRSWLV